MKADLAAKKIFLAAIVILNLGALCLTYRAISLKYSFKAEPVVKSSFLVGVLGGLVSLKIPTFGITNSTINQYLNPTALLGRGLTYLFFGPILLGKEAFDWTDYANPGVANQISGELISKDWNFIAEHYASHASNLVKYGFLDKESGSEMHSLYATYRPLQYKEHYYKSYAGKLDQDKVPNNPLMVELRQIRNQIKEYEGKWEKIKKKFSSNLPHPSVQAPKYGNWNVFCCAPQLKKA